MSHMVKNPPAHARDSGDPGLTPGAGRSSGVGNDYPLQYSCLENSWTEEPGRLHSSWGCKESYTTGRLVLALLVGMYMDTATMEESMEIP